MNKRWPPSPVHACSVTAFVPHNFTRDGGRDRRRGGLGHMNTSLHEIHLTIRSG